MDTTEAHEPAPEVDETGEKHPRIALMRAATRVEVALIMQRFSDRYDVFGPFMPCPVDPASVLSVTREGQLTRAYRCYELTQLEFADDGKIQRSVVSGFCFAKSYGDFKRYAEKELNVTLIPNPEAADGG
jgi:hypothetical protein